MNIYDAIRTTSKAKAFKCLGWKEYKSGKGVWSSEKEGAILITLWQQQIRWTPKAGGSALYVSMDELHPEGDPEKNRLQDMTRPQSRKHHKRAQRLLKAKKDPDIRIDVVVLFGPVGNDKGRAAPWDSKKFGFGPWKVNNINSETGFFHIEAKQTLKG